MILPLLLLVPAIQAEPPVAQLEPGLKFEGFVWIMNKLCIVVSVRKPNGTLYMLVEPGGE